MAKKIKSDKPANESLHAEEAKATDSPPITSNLSPEKKVFEGKINKYGFLHFGKPLVEAWQLSKGTEQPVTIELTAEGALIIRKT